jgi:hypothetical protein
MSYNEEKIKYYETAQEITEMIELVQNDFYKNY